MVELNGKEKHILAGLLLQVLVVGLLVFAYTQAVRQLKVNHESTLRLKEQLTAVQIRVQEKKGEELTSIQGELTRLVGLLFTRKELDGWAERLKEMASQFNFRDREVTVGMAERKIEIPAGSLPPFKLDLYAVELKGKAGTQEAVRLLAAVGEEQKRLCPLEKIELRALAQGEGAAVEVHLKWLVAVSDRAQEPAAQAPTAQRAADAPFPWGPRVEPFQSPFIYPSALRSPPAGRVPPFRLTGILWDPATPSAVINDTLLKPGDRLGNYRLVLLTSRALLLADQEEELFLPLPP